MIQFSYEEFTTRNFGFVNQSQQDTLRAASIFICGVGGMGGAALQSLVRAGVGHFIIADMDVFEVSNLNRQVFANLGTVDVQKTEATANAMRQINPQVNIETHDETWPNRTDDILSRVDIIINGMDDITETAKLYRAARRHGKTVIDAYAASLPSVYVTRPNQASPEERLDYPTHGKEPDAWTQDDLDGAFLRELEYVMACSSSRKYIDMEVGAEMAAGMRSRMSFAPMVILTGNLMAYEALNYILGQASGADNRGYFFNPHTGKTERPPIRPVEILMRRIAGRMIKKLMANT